MEIPDFLRANKVRLQYALGVAAVAICLGKSAYEGAHLIHDDPFSAGNGNAPATKYLPDVQPVATQNNINIVSGPK